MANASRRRWYQFSILSLLIVMAAVALLFALVIVPAWRQQQAVAQILDLGGQVFYDHEQPGAAGPRGPAWLRKLIGEDVFRTAVGVGLIRRPLDDAEKIAAALGQAAKLPAIESVRISGAGLNDTHFPLLTRMSAINTLFLSSPHITSAGIEHLANLTDLKSLLLAAPINDNDLRFLARLTELRHLELFAPITDAGLIHLEPLTHLELLRCTNTGSARIPRALDEKTEYDFQDVPPADAIEYFATIFDIAKHECRVDNAAVAAAGISFDTIAFTDAATGITLREALNRILAPHGLGFRIQDDQLVITTREESERAHAGLNALRQKLPRLRDIHVGW